MRALSCTAGTRAALCGGGAEAEDGSALLCSGTRPGLGSAYGARKGPSSPERIPHRPLVHTFTKYSPSGARVLPRVFPRVHLCASHPEAQHRPPVSAG